MKDSNGFYTNEFAARAEVEYLVNVGKSWAKDSEAPKVEDIDGHKYLFYQGKVQRIDPIDEQRASAFRAFSLSGLVDFIKADVDGMFGDPDQRYIVRVSNVDTVEVLSPITGYYKQRAMVAVCHALVPEIPFDKYMPPEDFQIMVQTRFAESSNRALVLKIAGNLRNEQSLQTADDGVSQKVTINKGVVTAEDVTIKNPVYLVPLRTFYEVEQPASPFVLRFNEGADVALFEGDGGAWKLKAVKNIKDWLDNQLKDCNVEVIA